LDLEILDAPLPLVDLGLGQLLVQLGLLGLELSDLGFQFGNALFSRHESNVAPEMGPGQGPRSRECLALLASQRG
jgi:hypothetical protein